MTARAPMAGVTLIELVISIVIVAVAVTGVLGVLTLTTQRSADPQRVQQAVAVAEGYLDEILLQPIEDPDGNDGETDRENFDDIFDYDGLGPQAPTAQDGSSLNLPGYEVSVAVAKGDEGGENITVGGGDAVPDADINRIDVTVTYGNDRSVTVTGYRAQP